MSLPSDWWTTGLEDEPCYGCGATPSKHEGHGLYTCKTCFEARFCKKCGVMHRAEKPCPTPEEIAAIEKEVEALLAECDRK